MKRGQRLFLEARLEIDEQVAAADQVHAREWRVADEVLPREYDHFAQRLVDAIAALLLDEESPQPLRRDILREGLRIQPVARLVQERIVQVGGEHLELAHPGSFVHRFHERHGYRIRFLARGAAERPDAQRFVAALRKQLGKHLPLEYLEGLRVAEKTRDADKHIGVERIQFLRVAAQRLRVAIRRILFLQHHAPGNAALDGRRLVKGKIDAGMVLQQQQDFPVSVRSTFRLPGLALAARCLGTRFLRARRWRSMPARRQRRRIVLMRHRGSMDVLRA